MVATAETITVGKGDVPNGFRWKRAVRGSRSPRRHNAWIFVTVFLIAIVMFLLASNLVRSRVGRATVAMRDNEIGGDLASGINSSKA